MKRAKGFALFSFITGLLMLSALFVPVSISQNPVDKVNGTPEGWSDDINLSETTQNHLETSLAVYQENVHVVWRYNPGPTRDILYRKSTDGGRTWGQKITLGSSPDVARLPDIALSEDHIHVVWVDYDGWNGIYYRNSTDNGETWNPERRVSPDGIDAYSPHVYVNNSNIHIIWGDTRDGGDGEIYYRRSLDGGITFDNGQGIDADRRITFSPATISGIKMAGDGSNISVAWADERDGDWEIYWMISKDNGFTWEDGLGTEHVGRKISNSVDDCVSQSIGVDGSNIHILWTEEQWPGPVYRLYYRNSTDCGVTWNTPQLLTGPSSLLHSPDIDVSGDKVHVVWQDERDDGDHEEIYYKNSTDGGISWSIDLRLTFNPTEWSRGPRIAVQNETKHVVWYDWYGAANRDVIYKRSPDFPDTYPPDHTNETPPPDSYRDAPGTNISVHVTDPSGVNDTTIQLYVNGSLVTHTSTPIMDGFNVTYVSPGFEPGVVECRIVADDNLSNHLDFTWNFTVLALYEIPLNEGWNLISVPHVQVDTAINEVLRDIDGKWNYIQWYDALDGIDHWKTNATFKPQQLNDLFYLNRSMAFWINITEPNVNLTVRGHISTYTEIQLYAGWNLVGYSTQNTETVANALWGTGADRVEVFNATAPYRIKEVGPTYVMKPGEGYWVHVAADSTWIINW